PSVPAVQHGRTAWYFPVYFAHPQPLSGQAINVLIDRITPQRTWGVLEVINRSWDTSVDEKSKNLLGCS
ncbi:MAG TPA: hypothetical protein VG722_05455, partial [Tepidisphaeraceae bacterium]|nr:hypothetical protein [Tepidisphaeraceae bacterium]